MAAIIKLPAYLKKNFKEIIPFLGRYLHIIIIVFIVLFYYSFFIFNLKFTSNGHSFFKDEIAIYIINFAMLAMAFTLQLPSKNVKVYQVPDLSDDEFRYLFRGIERDRVKEENNKANSAVLTFKRYWKFTLGLLLIFYGINIFNVAMETYDQNIEIPARIVNTFSNLLDLTSTYTFLGCVLVVYRPKFDGNNFSFPWFFRGIGIVILAVILIDILCDYFFSIQSKLLNNINLICSIFTGLFAGFVIAMFAGRMESRFLKTSFAPIVVLYLYAFLLFFQPIVSDHINGVLSSTSNQTTQITDYIQTKYSPSQDEINLISNEIDEVISSTEHEIGLIISHIRKILPSIANEDIKVLSETVEMILFKSNVDNIETKSFFSNILIGSYHLSFIFKAGLICFIIWLLMPNRLSNYLKKQILINYKEEDDKPKPDKPKPDEPKVVYVSKG